MSAEDMQLESPIETGRLPSESSADSSLIEIGGITFREGVDTGP